MISFNKEIRVFAEFIGTFCLVFLGAGAIVTNEVTNGAITHLGISLVFGIAVFGMIFLFGKVSGAHINPAVSIGLWLTGKLKTKFLRVYIFAQLSGALFASLLLKVLFVNNQNLGATLPFAGVVPAFLFELLATFALVQIILIVADSRRFRKHIALIIGALIFLEAFLGGPISGASMNPARSFGPAVVSQNLNTLWIYIFAPVLGGVAAAFVHQVFNKKVVLIRRV